MCRVYAPTQSGYTVTVTIQWWDKTTSAYVSSPAGSCPALQRLIIAVEDPSGVTVRTSVAKDASESGSTR